MIQLVPLDVATRPAFEALLAETWQQTWCEALAQQIVHWRYYDRMAGAETWLAMEHDRCVAMLDSMLRPYLLNGQRILVRETADWYCVPERRQHAIGLRLLFHLRSYPEPVFVLGGSVTNRQILSKMRGWELLPSASSFIFPVRARGLAANLIRQKWWKRERMAQLVPNMPIRAPRRISPPPGQQATVRVLGEGDALSPLHTKTDGLVQLFEPQHWQWLTKMPRELAQTVGIEFYLDGELVGFSLSQIEPAAASLDARIMYLQIKQNLAGWIISETTQILSRCGVGFIRCCVSTAEKMAALRDVGYMKTQDISCHWWPRSSESKPSQIDVGYLRADDAIPFQALRGRGRNPLHVRIKSAS